MASRIEHDGQTFVGATFSSALRKMVEAEEKKTEMKPKTEKGKVWKRRRKMKPFYYKRKTSV
jgi:hypothetical protein